ncbi:hypothetical protein QBC34DRAFT_499285 [Podospora aff. communis PSN243]|uniref:Uncharacterized protein n=1 Tax=Podospora aff. communis PSN243 TaxID=3040156 RepID=A0AAV9G680_9PEZI|nr:hypothetical protein QBC34DRAFT_499285 [Podospora aff. communis PSN243]
MSRLPGPGFGGYASDSRVGPYDANSTTFLNYLTSSNATGTFSLPLPDISKPYPGGGPIEGWTLSLAMLDIPDPGFSNRDESMLGYASVLKAPNSLLVSTSENTKEVNAHPSWGMCLWNFGEPLRGEVNNPSNKPLAQDGSCAGWLSPACLSKLEEQAKRSWKVVDKESPFGSRVACSTLNTPDECGENGPGNSGSATRSYQGVPVRYLNGSVTETDGWYYRSGRDRANSTEYVKEFWDRMVLNYWPFVTVLVDVEGEKDGEGLVNVACVAPNGQGTGKGFTFSGVKPALAEVEEEKDTENKKDAEKNRGEGRRISMGMVVTGCRHLNMDAISSDS